MADERERCPKCRKVVYRSNESAQRTALHLRSNVKTLSGVLGGYETTHAYRCPWGNGFHVGRHPRRKRRATIERREQP